MERKRRREWSFSMGIISLAPMSKNAYTNEGDVVFEERAKGHFLASTPNSAQKHCNHLWGSNLKFSKENPG